MFINKINKYIRMMNDIYEKKREKRLKREIYIIKFIQDRKRIQIRNQIIGEYLNSF